MLIPSTRARKDELDWSGLEVWRRVLRARLAPHCRDASEVDDLIQETFLKAASKRRMLQSPERLRAWLLRIAFNALRDQRRRGRIVGLVPLEEAMGVAEERASDPEDLWIAGRSVGVDEALEALSCVRSKLRVDDRALLDHFYGCGAGTKRLEELPKPLVKVRLFRARRRLGRALRQRLQRGSAVVGGRA